jgi:hypothetical protein
MEEKTVIHQLQQELPILRSEADTFSDLRIKWAQYFNSLIQNDFATLLSLLYRIDISENKLRYLLKKNPGEDAGELIATLVVERLLQKIKSREEYRSKPGMPAEDSGSEEW